MGNSQTLKGRALYIGAHPELAGISGEARSNPEYTSDDLKARPELAGMLFKPDGVLTDYRVQLSSLVFEDGVAEAEPAAEDIADVELE